MKIVYDHKCMCPYVCMHRQSVVDKAMSGYYYVITNITAVHTLARLCAYLYNPALRNMRLYSNIYSNMLAYDWCIAFKSISSDEGNERTKCISADFPMMPCHLPYRHTYLHFGVVVCVLKYWPTAKILYDQSVYGINRCEAQVEWNYKRVCYVLMESQARGDFHMQTCKMHGCNVSRFI